MMRAEHFCNALIFYFEAHSGSVDVVNAVKPSLYQLCVYIWEENYLMSNMGTGKGAM